MDISQTVFLNQPEEQHGGVRETIGNYLQYFLTPEVSEAFCTGDLQLSTCNLQRHAANIIFGCGVSRAMPW